MDSPKDGKGSKARTTVDIALQSIKIVKDFVPLEPVKGALSAVCQLLELLQVYMKNADDLSDIAKRCQRVALIIRNVIEKDQLKQDDDMMKAIVKLRELMDNISFKIKRKKEQSRWIKVFKINGDKDEILELKESLRDFLVEFQIELGLLGNMDVKEILAWIKAQNAQRTAVQAPSSSLYTPSKPVIFFGRDETLKICVDALGSKRNVALLGVGGIGKSTIAKALLNEQSIVNAFPVRLFIAYDNIASSAMTYQAFLDRIGHSLGLPTSTLPAILQQLRSSSTLLVVDNAESFLDAGDHDAGMISNSLDEIGAWPTTGMVLTSRNPKIIPLNLPWDRITVTALDVDAAHAAFSFVYPTERANEIISTILFQLEYHPLSINILANVAVMNEWTPQELLRAWEDRRSRVLEIANDKNRSLRVSIELSIVSFKDNQSVALKVLRAIAYLPQGIRQDDLPRMFPSVTSLMSVMASIRRSSLVYRLGDRLTMLAPIRLYMSDEYNSNLTFDDRLVRAIRRLYYGQLDRTPQTCVQQEHANLDRLLFLDIQSSHLGPHIDARAQLLQTAKRFLHSLCRYNPQPTSLGQLIATVVLNNPSSQDESLISTIAHCLTRACWLEYMRYHPAAALRAVSIAEPYCRRYPSVCTEQLLSCLRLRGTIHHDRGSLALSDDALREGSTLAKSMGNSLEQASLNHVLSRVALSRGNTIEATLLASSAQECFESHGQHAHLTSLLLHQSEIAIQEGDFYQASRLATRAMEIDRSENSGRRQLNILNVQASIAGWAGDLAGAVKLLDVVIEKDLRLDQPQFNSFVGALRGKAYYRAMQGDYVSARMLILQATELASEPDGLMSGYVELFAGELEKAKSLLERRSLTADTGENMQWKAIICRALGEVALLQSDEQEEKRQFRRTKSLCDEMGMPPRCLYVGYHHWLALPEETFTGWQTFLCEKP